MISGGIVTREENQKTPQHSAAAESFNECLLAIVSSGRNSRGSSKQFAAASYHSESYFEGRVVNSSGGGPKVSIDSKCHFAQRAELTHGETKDGGNRAAGAAA